MLNHIVNQIFYNSSKYSGLAGEILADCGDHRIVVARCSKPLQYVNLMNIPLPEPSYKILCICHAFTESDAFIGSLRASDQLTWDRIIDFKRSEDIFLFFLALTKIDFLFTEIDYGLRLAFPMREVWERGCEIGCYEEGSSMYCNGEEFALSLCHPAVYRRPLLRTAYRTARRLILRLLGSGTWYGRSKWTSRIYAYYPHAPSLDDCIDKCRPFTYSLMDQMKRLSYLFPLERRCPEIVALCDLNVLIIATGWNGDVKLNDDDSRKYDRIIVKQHPHIVAPAKKIDSGRILYMYGYIPTEFLTMRLLCNGNRVTLRSQFSSSMLYLMGSPVHCEYYDSPPEIFKSMIAYLEREKKN